MKWKIKRIKLKIKVIIKKKTKIKKKIISNILLLYRLNLFKKYFFICESLYYMYIIIEFYF